MRKQLSAPFLWLIWSLRRRSQPFVVANCLMLIVVVFWSLAIAVPANPFQNPPTELTYCRSDGHHDCP